LSLEATAANSDSWLATKVGKAKKKSEKVLFLVERSFCALQQSKFLPLKRMLLSSILFLQSKHQTSSTLLPILINKKMWKYFLCFQVFRGFLFKDKTFQCHFLYYPTTFFVFSLFLLNECNNLFFWPFLAFLTVIKTVIVVISLFCCERPIFLALTFFWDKISGNFFLEERIFLCRKYCWPSRPFSHTVTVLTWSQTHLDLDSWRPLKFLMFVVLCKVNKLGGEESE